MSARQILGGVLLVVGVALLFFAFQASNSPLDQLSQTFTGRYTSQTMWYLLSGIVAIAGGALCVMPWRRMSTH